MNEKNGYLTHIVQIGDSIQRIGLKYNITDWRDLVHLNNLEFPFIDDRINSNEYKENPHVATVGDSLLIPSNSYSTTLLAQSDISNIEARAYGSDLDIFSYKSLNDFYVNLEEKGEVSVNKSGDISSCDGLKNLRQHIITRLSVAKGSFILHPKYGSILASMVGMKDTFQTQIKMQLEVRRCLLSDPLIQDISEITVTKSGSGLKINCNISPVPPYQPFKFNEILSLADNS